MPKAVEQESWWVERAAHQRTRPAADGLRRLARQVAPGSTPVAYRRLGGGLATATGMVSLRKGPGPPIKVVLKRFPARNDPDAVHEWRRLRFAARLPVPTPDPIAFDRTGEWFETSSLVMSSLPGRPDVAPSDLDRWIREFARVQATIHQTRIARPPASIGSPDDLTPILGRGLRSTPTVAAASAYVARTFARAARTDLVVAHGDPHPGNVLWSRGRISGVTDWRFAGMYPRGHEVAYARADIAVLVGQRAADAYLEAYEREAGVRVRDLALWDLRQGLAAMRWGPLWAFAYRQQGAALTRATARRRARSFVIGVLARVGAR